MIAMWAFWLKRYAIMLKHKMRTLPDSAPHINFATELAFRAVGIYCSFIHTSIYILSTLVAANQYQLGGVRSLSAA